MQINPIAQLTAAPSSAPAGHDEPSPDKGFAKLLGDTDAKSGNEQSKQSLPGNEAKSAVLAAQEVAGDSNAPVAPPAPLDNLIALLGRQIDPNEAKAILDKFATMNQNGEQHDPAFDQLKEALEDIAGGSEVTDVGSMIEALPEVADAQPGERAPVLQRLLGWVSAAIDKHKEAPVAGAMPDGTVQSLQATLFSAGDDAARPAAQTIAQSDREEKTADVAQVIPDIVPATTDVAPIMAIESTLVAVTTVPVAVFVPTAQSTAMPEWVKKLGEGEENVAADAINEAIPPLALTEEEETLPVVNLPGLEDSLTVKAEPKVASRNFRELLENAPVANDNIEQPIAPVVTVDADGSITAPQTSRAPNGGSLTPMTVSAHTQLMPHVAAAEQVHVAITSMKKDGIDSITLQLEPADLGRVEIKMDTIDGRTQVSFLVDKAETLDALSRDARSLERQLQEAGVRADAGSMQFNLRQQPQQEMADDAKGEKSGRIAGSLDEAAAIEGVVTKNYTLNVKEGVDIHA